MLVEGYFDLFTIPLVRARAYNDLSEQRVLLKTRSSRVYTPQNGPILGSTDDT